MPPKQDFIFQSSKMFLKEFKILEHSLNHLWGSGLWGIVLAWHLNNPGSSPTISWNTEKDTNGWTNKLDGYIWASNLKWLWNWALIGFAYLPGRFTNKDDLHPSVRTPFPCALLGGNYCYQNDMTSEPLIRHFMKDIYWLFLDLINSSD